MRIRSEGGLACLWQRISMVIPILYCMIRTIIPMLNCWKISIQRKPLILQGARQVGKTWILKEFGRTAFKNTHYCNFQRDSRLHALFEGSLNPLEILKGIEFLFNTSISIADDLLILDEIQDCPRALTSLKYFQEDLPLFAVVSAGSLLGVTHPQSSFPVGKVEFLNLHPMSFAEFLQAASYVHELDLLQTATVTSNIPEPLHHRMMERLREYLVIGGMPEVVAQYVNSKDSAHTRMDLARIMQKQLLETYGSDFAKYSGRIAASHIYSVFESIPTQLAREHKNFKPSLSLAGSRFSQLRSAIEWLVGAGLMLKVPIIDHIEIPLVAQTQENRFKPYFFDVGLLGALADILPSTLILGDELFSTFKGALCENWVAQALHAAGAKTLYCWEGLQSEVEFVVPTPEGIYPIEVKSGASGKLKSLNIYFEKYQPKFRTRISAQNLHYRPKDSFANIPLWLAGRFTELIS